METPQKRPKVLMLGANALVCDNVRVLLRSMGYQCLVASTLNEALQLLQQDKPDAAILDPQLADDPPARVVASLHKRVPKLRGPPWTSCSAGIPFHAKSRAARLWSLIVFCNPRSPVSDPHSPSVANSVMNPTPS